jgi:hypothetical protein
MNPTVGLWRDDKHRYYAAYPDRDDANGLAMPGVTSVISKVDKSGPLIAWAKGVTADAALDNLDRLSDMVKADGREPTKAWLKAHATAESDRAKDLGTRIHLLAEQISRGASPDMDEIEVPFVAAYRRFLAEWRPEFKSLERFCANLKAGYGGTFDWMAYLDFGQGPKLTMGDTKSGKNTYAEVRLQLAALGMCEFLGLPNDPKRYRMPPIEQYAVLHIRPEAYERGYQLYKVDVNEQDRRAFLGALEIYKWDRDRPSKGEPIRARVLEEAA